MNFYITIFVFEISEHADKFTVILTTFILTENSAQEVIKRITKKTEKNYRSASPEKKHITYRRQLLI
jgi:hypothetical protein